MAVLINGFAELRHLELLMSAKKWKQKILRLLVPA